jgi:peptidoglycan/LPS O-acetylase OafA/YrhL
VLRSVIILHGPSSMPVARLEDLLSTTLTGRIRGFDGLRAIAFLLVFVSHKAPTPLTDRYGTDGVWIFFVLSGFLITRILAHSREKIEKGSSSPWTELSLFYIRRTSRIFPVYYAFLAALTILATLGLIDIGEPARQVSNWLYVCNFYIDRWGWRTDLGHLWSLAVEEQFYLLFAPLVVVLARHRLPKICMALITLSVATHAILLWRGSWHVSFEINSLINFGLMAIGGLAGLAAERPLPAPLRGDLPLLASLAAILAAPALFPDIDSWAHFGRVPAALTALALVQIYQDQHGRVAWLLDQAPLRGLGIISYGAYLFHPVIKSGTLLHLVGYRGELRHSAVMLLDLLVTVALASASYRLFERPIRNAVLAISANRAHGVSRPSMPS